MFTLDKLPYELSALEPVVSARTMELHYHKHHQAYVDNLNKLLTGTELENLSLIDIITKTAGQVDKQAIFNNAGQHFNHSFFWKSLRSAAGNNGPSGALEAALVQNFGSVDKFKADFKAAAGSLFGSGWVWLVKDGSELQIKLMANAGNPIAHNLTPVFGLDVWEHSYYLDYQNRRLDFVSAVLDGIVDWDFVSQQISL